MDPTAFPSQFYRGRSNDPSNREEGGRLRGRSRSGAAGLDSFPARSHNHPVPGNYVGRPFGPSDNPSVGRRLGNNGSYDGALACNHEPALPTIGLHRRRDHHYPPPPPPAAMQGARSRFRPQARRRRPDSEAASRNLNGLAYLRMLSEDGVAILGDFSELGMDLDRNQMGHESSNRLCEESITKGLKTRTFKVLEAASMDEEHDCCVICQEGYRNDEKIGFLDCGHEYHADCLKKWLLRKNVCPLCKAPAIQ